jgi:hypothetical protein
VSAAAPPAPRPKPARRLGGTFLGGAGGRLLPASVPFRWFAAAVVFHALAWLALAVGAAQWPSWRGGLGWSLAALHLVTLGTLVASAIGASLQLLPVATRQSVRWPRVAGALWWLFVPGVALLTLGMGLARPTWLAVGAAAVLAVLAGWGVLLALNLRGARGMPGVVLHGWGALAALVLLGVSATALVALWLGRPLLAPDSARALHLAAGVFGVMGLLMLGLSSILLPMFALAAVPDERAQLSSGGAALVALALAALAAFVPGAAFALRLAALAAGTLALALHLRLMRRVLASGMRSDLGRAGVWMQLGWAAAVLALLLALAKLGIEAGGGDGQVLGRLFVLVAVGGWLLSFLFGVLQRILPFLASMHAAHGAGPPSRRAPTPSALTLDRPLVWHLRCHVAALSLLAAATVTDSPALLLAAAALGFGGAAAFALFFAVLMRRVRRALDHDDPDPDRNRP